MLIRALIASGALTVAAVPATGTDNDASGSPNYELIADGDTIGAGIVIPDAVRPGDAGSRHGECSWRYYQYSVVPPAAGDEFSQRPFIREHPVTGRLQVAVDYVCGGTVIGIGWVDADPPPTADLIAGPRAQVQRQLPAPVPRIDPSGGATVNLGMWLAVEPVNPISASATLLGHRATVTASHTATVFDMGDGSVIRCRGAGSPLGSGDPLRFSAAAGPCGHVYQRPTPPGRPHRMLITMEWSVSYVTTSQRGSLSTLTTTAEVTMPVAEVQSIGIG